MKLDASDQLAALGAQAISSTLMMFGIACDQMTPEQKRKCERTMLAGGRGLMQVSFSETGGAIEFFIIDAAGNSANIYRFQQSPASPFN